MAKLKGAGGNEKERIESFLCGFEKMEIEDIALLEEDLIRLSKKTSTVVPSSKPTLICSIWTKKKTYNPDNFRAQMKSI